MQDIFNDMDKVIAKFSDDMRETFKNYHREEVKEEELAELGLCRKEIVDGLSGVIESQKQTADALFKKLDIAVEAFEEIELYRYDVNDIDQEDWFKIATSMAKIAKEAIARIKEIK